MKKLILKDDWVTMMTSECAEAMTMQLLNATNPELDDSECACLTCLARTCVEIILDKLHEESELEMMKIHHEENMKNNNIN
jgi:hypothetical protein